MKNQEIAEIFHEIAIYLEMKEVAFKPRAYERAAQSIEALEEDISDIYKRGGLKAIEDISSVGAGIGKRIEEYLKTGRIKDYEKLKKQIPVDIQTLGAIEGIGPKLIKLFYQKLKIKNLKDLEKAAKAGKLAKLPRSGIKLQEKILKGIKFYKRSHQRFLLGVALPLAEEIEARLKKAPAVIKTAVAGSARRRQETIGDLDFLVACPERSRGAIMNFFASMPEVIHVFAKGPTKTMVQLKNGVAADLRVVGENSFGSALQYFTGSKDHNIKLRTIAIKKGYKLNEYGLFRAAKQIAGKDEKEIYEKLGLKWVAPELRTNSGEIEAAQKNKLPKLVELKDVRGDLQVHSNWTDGSNSIEEMAGAAKKLGYEYIAITDHTKDLAMTGGSDEKKLLKQIAEIDKLNYKLKAKSYKLHILKGAEVNIRKDGTLDIKDDVLEKLDVVGAAVHSLFHLPKYEQTQRIIKVMKNPNVDIIFHLTGRLLQERPGIELDIDAILEAAKSTATILEINAFPNRLDLNDDNSRHAKNLGIKLSIGTDAHASHELAYMNYGVSQARRGWCEKKDIINTLSLKEMLKFLKKPKSKRF